MIVCHVCNICIWYVVDVIVLLCTFVSSSLHLFRSLILYRNVHQSSHSISHQCNQYMTYMLQTTLIIEYVMQALTIGVIRDLTNLRQGYMARYNISTK